MVNEVGRIHKTGKYNRNISLVTTNPLNTNLPKSNSHDNYNESSDSGSKEPTTTETYSRPSNDENDAL